MHNIFIFNQKKMNYNNYSNNNQIFYGAQNIPNSKYYKNQYEVYETYSNHSTQSNFSNNHYNNVIYINNYNNNYQILNKGKTLKPKSKNKIKKKVKFNEVVDVILVQSYKKYNKEDDDSSYSDCFREDNPYKDNNNKNHKKANKCECNII